MNFVTTFLARLVAVWLSAGILWLAVKFGIVLDESQQKQLVEHLVGTIIPLFVTLYALVHRLVSKRTNPGDAASGTLAEAERTQTSQLKAQR